MALGSNGRVLLRLLVPGPIRKSPRPHPENGPNHARVPRWPTAPTAVGTCTHCRRLVCFPKERAGEIKSLAPVTRAPFLDPPPLLLSGGSPEHPPAPHPAVEQFSASLMHGGAQEGKGLLTQRSAPTLWV